MTWIILLMSLVAGATVQTVLPSHAGLGQVKAPVLLAVVIYYALIRNRGEVPMCVAAFGGGFLQDALSPIPLGYSSAVFMVTAWGISRYRRLVDEESWVTPLFFGAVAGSAVTLVLSLLLMRADLVRVPTPRLLFKVGMAGGLGMVTTAVVFLFLGALERRVGTLRTVNEIDGTIEF